MRGLTNKDDESQQHRQRNDTNRRPIPSPTQSRAPELRLGRGRRHRHRHHRRRHHHLDGTKETLVCTLFRLYARTKNAMVYLICCDHKIAAKHAIY